MFRTFLLMLFLCGLTVLSGHLESRARAETSLCPSPPLPRVCVPDVKIPNCEVPDCEVLPPSRQSCESAWREHLMKTRVRCPQPMCFVFQEDPLDAVARVSTLDIMRAIGQ